MKQGHAIVLVTAGLLAASASARTQDYQLPLDPVSPTSRAECNALMDEYQAIANHVAERAKASGDLAWQIVMQVNGSNHQSSSLYARAQKLQTRRSRSVTKARRLTRGA